MKFYGVFVLLFVAAVQAGAQEVVEYKIPRGPDYDGVRSRFSLRTYLPYRGDAKFPNGPLGAMEYEYMWNGPHQAYCEARLLKLADGTDDFTYENWREVEERLVTQWFPIGTSIDDAFNHFSKEGFTFSFKSYGSPGADEGILRDEDEHYVRFETWSLRGKTHYLQHLIYFVFDKSSPAWNSRRIQVVHNIRKKIRMSRLLDECEMEDVKRDKEKFDWNRVDHFYTEARRMGLVTDWRRNFPGEELEKVAKSLWDEWFSDDTSAREVLPYLVEQGFYVDYPSIERLKPGETRSNLIFELRNDYSIRDLLLADGKPLSLKKHTLRLRLTLKLVPSVHTPGDKTVRWVELSAYGGYGGRRERASARAKSLARIAKREGRALFE